MKKVHQDVQYLNAKKEVKELMKGLEDSLKEEGMPYHIITSTYDPCFQPLSSDGKFGTLPRTHDIKIKEDSNPVIVPPRKIAHALKRKVKAKLDKMVAEGIITKVETYFNYD